jgi:hypothetical protein
VKKADNARKCGKCGTLLENITINEWNSKQRRACRRMQEICCEHHTVMQEMHAKAGKEINRNVKMQNNTKLKAVSTT